MLSRMKYKSKVVPVLNWAPRREGVCGSRGIAPRILNLGAYVSSRLQAPAVLTPRIIDLRYPFYNFDNVSSDILFSGCPSLY